MTDLCDCEEGETNTRATVGLEGILLPLAGILGLGGNGLAVMAFRWDKQQNWMNGSFPSSKFQNQRSTFSLLLTVLAIVDILCIITFLGWNYNHNIYIMIFFLFVTVDYSVLKVWDVTISNKFLLYVSAYVWFPVKNVLLTLESYLIVAISVERYLAVCR